MIDLKAQHFGIRTESAETHLDKVTTWGVSPVGLHFRCMFGFTIDLSKSINISCILIHRDLSFYPITLNRQGASMKKNKKSMGRPSETLEDDG